MSGYTGMHRAAPYRSLFERVVHRVLGSPELIGPPACPIMHRWGLLGEDVHRFDQERGEIVEKRAVKVLLHHFLPNSNDRDPHDHPRSFVTIVLAGEYIDEDYGKTAYVQSTSSRFMPVRQCMRPGTIRLRRAGHTHTTLAGPRGCWTLVVMGPITRDWGFWRGGLWWAYKDYKKRFGHGMECP